MLTKKERLEHQRQATQRWRERNHDKVREANRRKRIRIYDPAKSKAWREKRMADPKYRKALNARNNARAVTVRRWLDNFKLEHGCLDCGFRSHPAALHFDHVKFSKSINVCNSKSITGAQEEIKKCVVRCANCHAIKTWPHLLARKLP